MKFQFPASTVEALLAAAREVHEQLVTAVDNAADVEGFNARTDHEGCKRLEAAIRDCENSRYTEDSFL